VRSIAEQLGVPEVIVAALAVFAVVQLALQVYCLVDLARRPAVTGGRKWLWALVIVFVSGVVGSILYLAVGRQAALVDEHAALPEPDSTRTAREVIDLLYGPRAER
jgi:phospholipase D-like protein